MKTAIKNILILVAMVLLNATATFGNTDPNRTSTIEPLPALGLKTVHFSKANIVPVLTENIEVDRQTTELTDEIKAFAPQQFAFPDLEAQVAQLVQQQASAMMPPEEETDNLGAAMVLVAKGNLAAKAKKAKEIICKAKQIGNYIDALTGGDLVKMPIIKKQRFGNIDVEIIFNSAEIHPQFAKIEVFVRMVVPQKEVSSTSQTDSPCDQLGSDDDGDAGKTVLYFGANDIYFSQEQGIVRGSVGLLSDYAIQMGGTTADPKAGILLTKMEKGRQIAGSETSSELDDEFNYKGTYINFDCDGFKEIGVGGRIYFSREWITPTDDIGRPKALNPRKDLGSTARVRADIQVIAQSWEDILLSVNLSSPFTLSKWPEMTFALGNANLDLSSIRNPTTLPTDYPTEAEPADASWEGLYVQTLSITLPKQFKRLGGSLGSGSSPPPNRIKLSATDLIIDDLGVSGEFILTSQVPLIGGAVMDGEWGYSLDIVGVTLRTSDVEAFTFEGELGVPLLSKHSPIAYTGFFDFGMDIYLFKAELSNLERSIPIWQAAQVDIVRPGLTIQVSSSGEEFEAEATFDRLGFSIGMQQASNATGTESKLLKVPSVALLNVSVKTSTPRVSVGGVELTGSGSSLMKFPVTLGEGTRVYSPQGRPDELIFDIALQINLTKQEDRGVSATGFIEIIGDYVKDEDGLNRWKYRELNFKGAHVEVSLPQFYGEGDICMFKEDDEYGKGFAASISAKIIGKDLHEPDNDGKFELDMMAIFGSKDDYRYFLVDGFLSGLNVGIYPPAPGSVIFLDGFGGGVFHHMKPDRYEEGVMSNGTMCPNAASASDIIYVPSKQTKLGINFATSFVTRSGVIKGKLTCIIRFDQGMALQNITFWGVADIMPPTKITNAVEGTLKKTSEALSKVTKPLDKLKSDALTESQDVGTGGIKVRLGLSLDFEGKFSFHGFAEATIEFKRPSTDENGAVITTGSGSDLDTVRESTLKGVGSLDLLIDPDANRFHIYLGGYYPTGGPGNLVTVPDFFSGEEMTLQPVSIWMDYGGFRVSANFYFLTGNDIPGPPPPPAEVVEFFNISADENNRGILNDCGHNPALGTGIAFGASAFISFEKEKRGFLGSCIGGYNIKVNGGLGFDISLLKYGKETRCSNGQSPHGLNGFRATGRAYVFVDLDGRQVTCLPLPPLGLGLLIEFDVPNPARLDILVVVKVGARLEINLGLGEKCGMVCEPSIP